MGLDMFLKGKKCVNSCKSNETNKYLSSISELLPQYEHIPNLFIEYEWYLRQANAIHAWFINNVQNGKETYDEVEITRSQMQQLLDLVCKVLSSPSCAQTLLPTTTKFRFQEYDDFYFSYLKSTRDILQSILHDKLYDNYWQFTYYACW